MAQLFIRKTILIRKDQASIFKILHDFHQWPKWSPWLIADPKANIQIEADGKSYRWESPILGSGEMKIINEEENQSIHYDLQFFKPWESKAKVSFFLNYRDTDIEVVWTMQSRLPFFMFWMKKKMEVFVGMDYERGLLLLKDYAEHGKSNCNLNFEGVIPFEETPYMGLYNKTSYKDFKNQMAKDFSLLLPYTNEHYKDIVNGPAFSIYHKFDVLKNRVEYTLGVPIKYTIPFSQKEFHIGSFPKMKVYSIELNGPFRHLPNAWAAQQMRIQNKKIKPSKKNPPFELYLNNPTDTPEEELRTKVLFPVH